MGLTPGSYYFVVTAYLVADPTKESTPSNEASVTPVMRSMEIKITIPEVLPPTRLSVSQ